MNFNRLGALMGAAALSMTAASAAHATEYQFSIVYGNNYPGYTETFNIDASQMGVSSPTAESSGAAPGQYSDFAITNDSLGFLVAVIGNGDGDSFFNLLATGADDYDAETNFNNPYLNPTTSIYNQDTQMLSVFDGEVVTGEDGSVLTISALTSAAPEPSTWALMFAGVGLAGFALRSRKQIAVATA